MKQKAKLCTHKYITCYYTYIWDPQFQSLDEISAFLILQISFSSPINPRVGSKFKKVHRSFLSQDCQNWRPKRPLAALPAIVLRTVLWKTPCRSHHSLAANQSLATSMTSRTFFSLRRDRWEYCCGKKRRICYICCEEALESWISRINSTFGRYSLAILNNGLATTWIFDPVGMVPLSIV